MKKVLLSALALCIALCVSCKKDNNNGGNVSPTIKKALKDTYGDYKYATYISEDQENWELVVEGEIDNVLTNDYIYDGDKLIAIQQNSFTGTYGWTDSISYSEDGFVTQIIDYYWNEFGTNLCQYDFVYDNGLISKVNCYYEGDYLGAYYDYYYTDNKLSKVVYTHIDYDKAPKHHRYEKFNHRDNTYCVELTWTGDNVTQSKESGEGWEYVETYDYDNKNNPYIENDALVAYSYICFDFAGLSKNNVTLLSTNFDNNVTYSYEYKGNYPSEEEICYEYIYEEPVGTWNKNNETYHYYLNYR